MVAESIQNCPAACEFGTDGKYVRQWQSDIIERMPKSEKARCSGTAHWPE